jgi:hypothetical protein
MSYRRSILASFITSNDSTGPLSGWTPRNLYAVDVNNDGIPDLIQDQYWVSTRGAYNLQSVFGVSIANGVGTFKPAVPYNYPPSRGWGPWPSAISMEAGS